MVRESRRWDQHCQNVIGEPQTRLWASKPPHQTTSKSRATTVEVQTLEEAPTTPTNTLQSNDHAPNKGLKMAESWQTSRKASAGQVAGDLESLKAGKIKTSRNRVGGDQGFHHPALMNSRWQGCSRPIADHAAGDEGWLKKCCRKGSRAAF